MANKNGRINFENVLDLIREQPENVFKKHARMLSDLTREKTARLQTVLSKMSDENRAAFFRMMDESNMLFFEYNFAPIAQIGINDPDGEVRTAAIHVLGFEDSREIGAQILSAAENDPYEKAQITAVEILGQYMFESALDNRIPVSQEKLKQTLEKLIESKNEAVRRAAVVSYAISENDRVKQLISGYLAGNDREELIAGLAAVRHAMGEEWNESVLELMRHEDEEVSLEAIRTAGALQLREALPALYEILSRFDRISPELLLTTTEAVAEIGDEGSLDVLETLGEAAIDMDDEITEAIDDAIDTLNMAIHIGPTFETEQFEEETPKQAQAFLEEAIENAKDQCLSILEEKIPHDFEDDEALDYDDDGDDDDDECECGEHHHHHGHHHHDNPLEGMDLSRFRILDDLEAYEADADRDADEDELWAEFEEMAEEDLDAESLQDFINKLEKQKKRSSGKKH